jgi:hypothetical protein
MVIDRAAVTDTHLAHDVATTPRVAPLRALADRTEFVLDDKQRRAWDRIKNQPARGLAGLRALMARPSPFTE